MDLGLGHTHSVPTENTELPRESMPANSPLAFPFRQFAHTNPDNAAYADPPHLASDQESYRVLEAKVTCHHRGVGSPVGQKCGTDSTAAPHHPADPFRHSGDLFRQWVINAPSSSAYAAPHFGYRKQVERNSLPAVCTELAPPRGMYYYA